jgi:hypothetical protein
MSLFDALRTSAGVENGPENQGDLSCGHDVGAGRGRGLEIHAGCRNPTGLSQ